MPFEPKFADLARNFTTTTGTGNIVLGNAVSGHVSLAGAVTVGERFYYCILGVDKPAQREVGRGTMMANGTIAREAISGALFNFTSGSKTISLVAAAEWFRTMGQMVNGGSDSLAALATTNKTSLVAAVNEVAAAAAGGGGGGGAATDVLFVAAGGTAVPASKKVFVTAGYSIAGEGGATYVVDAAVNAAFVTANPRTAFVAADGRGFRLDASQRLRIEMFGGGTAKTGAENYAAINAAIDFKPDPTRNFSPTVHFGIGTYLVSERIEVHTCCHLKGMSSGHNGSPVQGFAGTALQWPINTPCIRIHNSNTLGDGVRSPTNSAFSGNGSVIEGLWIKQATQGATLTAHGVQMRATATLRECIFSAIAGTAVYIQASAGYGGALEGDCNNWRVYDCFVHSCGGDGMYVEGQDANAGLSVHFITAVSVGGCGIRDSASLGNTHIEPQITGYGNGGVFHLGAIYQLNSEVEGIGGATTPGTNNDIWYKIKDQAAANAPFPQWASMGTYYNENPLLIAGPSTVVGGYQEISNVKAHCPGGAILNGQFDCTTSSNEILAQSGGNGLASVTGIGARRGSGADTTTLEYADEGAYSLTMLGTTDIITGDRTKRPNILEHRTEQDGASSVMAWHWSAKDQYLRYLNAKPIWSFGGPGTARTYGRDTPQPYCFSLHDFALIDSGNTNNARIMGLRGAAPTSGYHAQGEFFFNVAPTATGIFGWSCTTAGTPGTWTAVPVAGFSGSYSGAASFGDVTIGSGVDGRALFVTNTSGYGLRAALNASTSTLYLSNQLGAASTFASFQLRGNPIVLNHNNSEVARTDVAGFDVTGRVRATGEILSNSPTAGVGYRTGAGGVVTQATSKTTGVTLNRVAGQVTLNAASLAAGASASFTLTNSAIAATDAPIVSIASGATADAYAVTVTAVAAGSCRIQLRNMGAVALAEALVLNFAVIKAVAA